MSSIIFIDSPEGPRLSLFLREYSYRERMIQEEIKSNLRNRSDSMRVRKEKRRNGFSLQDEVGGFLGRNTIITETKRTDYN